MEHKPRGRPDVVSRSSHDQRMLYDSSKDKIHVLNETAEFIWELCDGAHTLDDIESKLREQFEVPADIDVRQDIESTLASLEKKGLLVSAEEAEVSH